MPPHPMGPSSTPAAADATAASRAPSHHAVMRPDPQLHPRLLPFHGAVGREHVMTRRQLERCDKKIVGMIPGSHLGSIEVGAASPLAQRPQSRDSAVDKTIRDSNWPARRRRVHGAIDDGLYSIGADGPPTAPSCTQAGEPADAVLLRTGKSIDVFIDTVDGLLENFRPLQLKKLQHHGSPAVAILGARRCARSSGQVRRRTDGRCTRRQL